MNKYSDLSLDVDQPESTPESPTPPPWLNLLEAFQFLMTFHAMVITGLHEMKRIRRDLVVFANQPDLEMREQFKTDQAYLNEIFYRLRASLREFMDSGRGIKLPT